MSVRKRTCKTSAGEERQAWLNRQSRGAPRYWSPLVTPGMA
jgi:hypothetical protein